MRGKKKKEEKKNLTLSSERSRKGGGAFKREAESFLSVFFLFSHSTAPDMGGKSD